jgi:hypothetical protein
MLGSFLPLYMTCQHYYLIECQPIVLRFQIEFYHLELMPLEALSRVNQSNLEELKSQTYLYTSEHKRLVRLGYDDVELAAEEDSA